VVGDQFYVGITPARGARWATHSGSGQFAGGRLHLVVINRFCRSAVVKAKVSPKIRSRTSRVILVTDRAGISISHPSWAVTNFKESCVRKSNPNKYSAHYWVWDGHRI